MATGNVYVIKDPETLEIRYVGQTINSLSKRLSLHIYTKDKAGKSDWLNSLLANGKKPIIEEIESVDHEQLLIREAYWINFYKEQGCNLFNADSGRPKGEPTKPLGLRVPIEYHDYLTEFVYKELAKLAKAKTK